jgi:hypothetical protein
MSAGFKYDLKPKEYAEEMYDVKSGIRRRGSYILQTANLTVGKRLPAFAPIYADKVLKKAYPVCNSSVYASATTTDTVIKVAKGTLAYVGMFIGNGKKGATVQSVDTTNSDYDAITVDATLGVALNVGDVLFEATAAGGTVQKYIANSALYGSFLVEDGINNVTLLRTAAEIEASKLIIPFSANDKAALAGWFDFNE